MKKLSVLLILLLFILSGCLMMPAYNPAAEPPTLTRPVLPALRTRPVAWGEIRREETFLALYVPPRSEPQRFGMWPVPIADIFVTAGSVVSQGDIIAALYLEDVQAQFEELSMHREALEFDLEFLIERQAFFLRFNTGPTPYDTRIENLTESLAFADRLYGQLYELNSARYLRASMDGVVSFATTFSPGMNSSQWMVVAVISDQPFSLFAIEHEAAGLFNLGDRFEVFAFSEHFLMEVVNPADFGFTLPERDEDEDDEEEEGEEPLPRAYLSFIDPPAHEIATGTRIEIHKVLDVVTDVLIVPSRSVHHHGNRVFVYVDVDGLRAVRDVVTGIDGGGFVEIVEGLEEGELVVY